MQRDRRDWNDRRPPRPARRPAPPAAPRPRVTVAWTDDELFVLEKPPGMPCVAGRDDPRQQGSLVDALVAMIRQERGGRPRAWIGQRLDDEASGLVLLGATARSGDWVRHTARPQRTLVALVEGQLQPGAVGTISKTILDTDEGPVRVVEEGESVRAARAVSRHGHAATPRRATTHYRVEASGEQWSLVRVRSEGDCRHQVRAHLASIGRPIAGDLAYGAATDPLGRVALHCTELSFTHPQSNEQVRVRLDIPHAMGRLVQDRTPAEQPAPASDSASAGGRASQPAPPAPPAPPASDSSWDEVAGWYDELVEDRRNDLLHEVVQPGVLRLLGVRPGERVLDLACGQGSFARRLAEGGAMVWGIDASPRLIGAANARAGDATTFLVADATRLDALPPDALPGEGFDGAVCVMALMNLDPLDRAIGCVARRLKPGGRFVCAVLHPAFRNPGGSSWGWDGAGSGVRQYRRVDAYLSPARREIVMNPGQAAHGAEPVVTWTFHRPIGAYVRALAAHGLVLDALEEWASPRRSEPGPRAGEENRARAEFPMFLAIRARRPADA